MGTLTRFADNVTGKDGPVSGALVTLHGVLAVVTAVNTYNVQFHMPVGMGFQVTDIEVFAGTVTATPELTAGTAEGGVQLVAAANLSTGANITTLVADSGEIAAGGIIDVQIDAATGDSIAGNTYITVAGYYTSPPTSVPVR